MAILKTRSRCCMLLSMLLSLVFSLGHRTTNQGLKKHKQCIHIVSINVPSDDPAQSSNNYAFKVNGKKAFLSRNPGIFQIKHGGFLGIKETVAIESVQNPGYYLRHKNYKFHLQKAKNSSIFARDATFYLLKVQNDPPFYAFELYGHPSWFIMHNNRNHTLILGHVKGSENEVMDSTFSLKKVNCHQKRRQGRVQKKTVVVGHGSLMEDQSDDDQNDMEYNEEYVNNDNANTVHQTAIKEDKSEDGIMGSEGILISKSAVIKNGQKDDQNTVPVTRTAAKTESGNVAKKEQDIIHEVEQAFNASNPKKNGNSLDVMEKDIERKVNDLASSLYEQNNQKTFTGKTRSVDVVIQDSDNSSIPEKQAVDQDVIIKVEDPATKGGIVNSMSTVPNTQMQKTDKPTFFSKKSLKTGNPLAITKSNKVNSIVVKGSPKLVNEHYSIIARASLAIPDGNEKHQNRMMKSNGEAAAYKHDQILNNQNENKILQSKVQNTKQLFGTLGGSVHISNDGSSLNTAVAGNRRDSQPYYNNMLNNNNTKLKQNETKILFQYKSQRKLNRTLATNGRPVVYFSEKCQNSLPNVCEVWAQKRYCLTFNELMKRYCRKSCGLCDPIVTTGFSPCDKSCGGGIRLRMIKVNNRQVLQRRACNTHECPIDGGYTPFSDLSECSATCGKGLRYKHRTCTQPPPQFGGKDCTRLGSPIKTVECHVAKCEVNNGKKLRKQSHSLKQANDDYEHMPEYQVEKLNTGEYTVKIDTPEKLNPGIFKHISGNLYQYTDKHGKKKTVRLKGRHGKSFHEHHVYHKEKQVGKLKCGASKFPKYHQMESNFPLTRSNIENQKRELENDNPYKMYESGKIMYDKYGIPSGTTDQVVKSSASPYKIILHKNKNHELVVSEECLESDSSVNPDDDDDDFERKNFQKPAQGFSGYNQFEDPSHSYGPSSLLAQSTLGNEVRQAMGSIGRAIDYDTNAIATSTLMQKEVPKLTLSEELAAENEEALKERRYEENMAETSNENFAYS